MKRFLLLCLILCGASTRQATAKVILSPLFGNHMVLQQNCEAAIWGQSDQKSVTIISSWGERTEVKVNDKGTWRTTLSTPYGSFEKHWLKIEDKNSQHSIEDLLIGEVWICSGQSNMYMPMRGYSGQPVKGAFEAALESPRYTDRIRMITIPKREAEVPQENFEGSWERASPASIWKMSATAYFFAQTLTRALDLPIGIVVGSWGGSIIEAWMSPEDLRAMGYRVEEINADSSIEARRQCSKLYNGLIAPIEGFAARGFTWYQGESNLHTADRYAEQMERLVRFWRERWGDSTNQMPFLYVQIAPYRYPKAESQDAPRLVEAQLDALDRIPNSDMVCTTDIGDRDCIHPADKLTVGQRLAAQAMQHAYDFALCEGAVEGVRLDRAEYADGKVTLYFRNARYGLTPEGEEILGFEVAGSDGVYHPAHAEIVRTKPRVVVWSPEVSQPVAVRYAFHDYTPTNLHNTLGQPLFPFRTQR